MACIFDNIFSLCMSLTVKHTSRMCNNIMCTYALTIIKLIAFCLDHKLCYKLFMLELIGLNLKKY